MTYHFFFTTTVKMYHSNCILVKSITWFFLTKHSLRSGLHTFMYTWYPLMKLLQLKEKLLLLISKGIGISYMPSLISSSMMEFNFLIYSNDALFFQIFLNMGDVLRETNALNMARGATACSQKYVRIYLCIVTKMF